jgi:hypothetical protein
MFVHSFDARDDVSRILHTAPPVTGETYEKTNNWQSFSAHHTQGKNAIEANHFNGYIRAINGKHSNYMNG